jgi:hypothetical protein
LFGNKFIWMEEYMGRFKVSSQQIDMDSYCGVKWDNFG